MSHVKLFVLIALLISSLALAGEPPTTNANNIGSIDPAPSLTVPESNPQGYFTISVGVGDSISGNKYPFLKKGAIYQVPPYIFTVTSANATLGSVYSNNSQTFTTLVTIAAGTTLRMRGSGLSGASGTLTKVSGSGDATITFSSVIAGSTAHVARCSIFSTGSTAGANSGQFVWADQTYSNGASDATFAALSNSKYEMLTQQIASFYWNQGLTPPYNKDNSSYPYDFDSGTFPGMESSPGLSVLAVAKCLVKETSP